MPLKWGISKKDSFFERKIKLIFRNNFGYVPKNLFYYKEALRHRSILENKAYKQLQSNERLEFLGDSLLGAFTAAHLFKQYPDADEGFLTKTRSKIVSRSFLNQLACKLQVNQLVKNALHQGQETNTIYGNALEAIFGAIYLEKGETILFKVFEQIFKQHINLDSIENTETDYKSRLFEYAQKERKLLQFEVLEENMLHNRKIYTISARIDSETEALGTGSSKKKAEQEACKKLIELLRL